MLPFLGLLILFNFFASSQTDKWAHAVLGDTFAYTDESIPDALMRLRRSKYQRPAVPLLTEGFENGVSNTERNHIIPHHRSIRKKQGEIFNHVLPPVEKEASRKTDKNITSFKIKQSRLLRAHRVFPLMSKNNLHIDKQEDIVNSHHALPPVHGRLPGKKSSTVNPTESQQLRNGRRNLVQFRDSNGKVIATLHDSRNFNNANVTLSKADDAKRFAEMIHGATLAKKTTLITKYTEKYPGHFNTQVIKNDVGLREGKPDKKTHANSINRTAASVSNKNVKKTGMIKNDDLLHTTFIEDKPIDFNYEPYPVPEASKVPIDWKILLHADDIADNIYSNSTTNQNNNDKKKTKESNLDAREVLKKTVTDDKHISENPVEHKQRHFIEDVDTDNSTKTVVSKREVSNLAELMDDAIEFYDELDQLNEIEEDTNVKPISSPRRIEAHNLNAKKSRIPAQPIGNGTFLTKHSLSKEKQSFHLKKKDEIEQMSESSIRHLHYNDDNDQEGRKKSSGWYDDSNYAADDQVGKKSDEEMTYDDDVYVSDGRGMVTKDTEPMFDDARELKEAPMDDMKSSAAVSKGVIQKNSTGEEDVEMKESESYDDGYDQSDVINQVEHSAKKDVNDHPDLSDYVIRNPKKIIDAESELKLDPESIYPTDSQSTKRSEAEEIKEVSDVLDDSPSTNVEVKTKKFNHFIRPNIDISGTTQSIYPLIENDDSRTAHKYNNVRQTAMSMVEALEKIAERHNQMNMPVNSSDVDSISRSTQNRTFSKYSKPSLSPNETLKSRENKQNETYQGPPDVDDLLDATYAGDKKLKDYENEIAKTSQQTQTKNNTTVIATKEVLHDVKEHSSYPMLEKNQRNSPMEMQVADHSYSPVLVHNTKLESAKNSSSLNVDETKHKFDRHNKPPRININVHIKPEENHVDYTTPSIKDLTQQIQNLILSQHQQTQMSEHKPIGVQLFENYARNPYISKESSGEIPEKQIVTITPDLLKESLKKAFRDFAKEIKSEGQAQSEKKIIPNNEKVSSSPPPNLRSMTNENKEDHIFPYLSTNNVPSVSSTNSYAPTSTNNNDFPSLLFSGNNIPPYSYFNLLKYPQLQQNGMLDRKEHVNKPSPISNFNPVKDDILNSYKQVHQSNFNVSPLDFDFGHATGFIQSLPYDMSNHKETKFDKIKSDFQPTASSLEVKGTNVRPTYTENSQRRQDTTISSTISSNYNYGSDACNPMPQCQQYALPLTGNEPILQTPSPYAANSFIMQNSQPAMTTLSQQQAPALVPVVNQVPVAQPSSVVQQVQTVLPTQMQLSPSMVQYQPNMQIPLQQPQLQQDTCFGGTCQTNNDIQNCANQPCRNNGGCINPPCGGANEWTVSDMKSGMECFCSDGSGKCPCSQTSQPSCENSPCPSQLCPSSSCHQPSIEQQDCQKSPCTNLCKKPPCVMKFKTVVNNQEAPSIQTIVVKKPARKILRIVQQAAPPPEIVYAAAPPPKNKVVYLKPPPPPPKTIVVQAPIQKKIMYAPQPRRRIKLIAPPAMEIESELVVQRPKTTVVRGPPIFARAPAIVQRPSIIEQPAVLQQSPAIMTASPPAPAVVNPSPVIITPLPPVVASPPAVESLVAPPSTVIAPSPAVTYPSLTLPASQPASVAPPLNSGIEEKPKITHQIAEISASQKKASTPVVSGVIPGGVVQTVASVFTDNDECNEIANRQNSKCLKRGFDFTTEANNIKATNFAKSSDNIERLVKGISRRAHQTGGVVNSDLEEKISDFVAEAIVDAKRSRDRKKKLPLDVLSKKWDNPHKKQLDETKGFLRHKITTSPIVREQHAKVTEHLKVLKHAKDVDRKPSRFKTISDQQLLHGKYFSGKIPTVADLLQLQSFYNVVNDPNKMNGKHVELSTDDTPFKRKILTSLHKHPSTNLAKRIHNSIGGPVIAKIFKPKVASVKLSPLQAPSASKRKFIEKKKMADAQLTSKQSWKYDYKQYKTDIKNSMVPPPSYQSVSKLEKSGVKKNIKNVADKRISKLSGVQIDKYIDLAAQHKIKLFEDALSSLRNELKINGEKMFRNSPQKEETLQSVINDMPLPKYSLKAMHVTARRNHHPAPSMFEFMNRLNSLDGVEHVHEDVELSDVTGVEKNDTKALKSRQSNAIQGMHSRPHEGTVRSRVTEFKNGKSKQKTRDRELDLKQIINNFETNSKKGTEKNSLAIPNSIDNQPVDAVHSNNDLKTLFIHSNTVRNKSFNPISLKENFPTLVTSIDETKKFESPQLYQRRKIDFETFIPKDRKQIAKNINSPAESVEEEMQKSAARYKGLTDAITALKHDTYLSIVEQPKTIERQHNIVDKRKTPKYDSQEKSHSKFHNARLKSKLSQSAMRMLLQAEKKIDEKGRESSNLDLDNTANENAISDRNMKTSDFLKDDAIPWRASLRNNQKRMTTPFKFLEREFDVTQNSTVAAPTMRELKRMQIPFEKTNLQNEKNKKNIEGMENKISNVESNLSNIASMSDNNSKISKKVNKRIVIDITESKSEGHNVNMKVNKTKKKKKWKNNNRRQKSQKKNKRSLNYHKRPAHHSHRYAHKS